MQSSTSISQLFLTTILPVVTSISRNFQTCENHLDCRFGGTCETSKFIKNVKGICKCKHNCYKYAEKAICTMDGNIFYSHCELQRQECLERRKITIMCDGHDCENYFCGMYSDEDFDDAVESAIKLKYAVENPARKQICDDGEYHCHQSISSNRRHFHGVCLKQIPDGVKFCECSQDYEGSLCMNRRIAPSVVLKGHDQHSEGKQCFTRSPNLCWVFGMVSCLAIGMLTAYFLQCGFEKYTRKHGIRRYSSQANVNASTDYMSPIPVSPMRRKESFSAFPPRSRHDSISSGVRILRHPSFCENDPNSRILQKRASLQLSVPPMIQGLGASTENMSTGNAYFRSNQNSRQSERITRPNSTNFQNSPSTSPSIFRKPNGRNTIGRIQSLHGQAFTRSGCNRFLQKQSSIIEASPDIDRRNVDVRKENLKQRRHAPKLKIQCPSVSNESEVRGEVNENSPALGFQIGENMIESTKSKLSIVRSHSSFELTSNKHSPVQLRKKSTIKSAPAGQGQTAIQKHSIDVPKIRYDVSSDTDSVFSKTEEH